jgi:type I restriction enzyme S subunit
MQICLPSRQQQDFLVNILDAFEKMIALNRRINDNLEQQAHAIFKSWFVDFEPFRYGEFVESELGMIPTGWTIERLDKVIELFDSKRIPLSGAERDKMAKIYPYYGAATLMDFVEDYIFDGVYLLLGEDGTVMDDEGYPILQYVWGKFWVNNHAHILQGTNGVSVEYLYILLKNTPIKGIVTGAVQPKINQANLKSLNIILPPEDVRSSFSNLLPPLFSQIRHNADEVQYLISLRDTLLPKLMSGELSVEEVESQV